MTGLRREALCESCGRRVSVRRDGRLAKHKMYGPNNKPRGWAWRQANGWTNPECAASETVVVPQ